MIAHRGCALHGRPRVVQGDRRGHGRDSSTRSSCRPRSPTDRSGNGWRSNGNVLYALVGTRKSKSTRSDRIDAGWATGPGACGRATTTATPGLLSDSAARSMAIDRSTGRDPVALSRRRVPGCPRRMHERRSDSSATVRKSFWPASTVRRESCSGRTTASRCCEAIGPNGRAQHYVTGYATTCYMKCNDDYLFFAGPQRERMVVASADDGNLAWTYPLGNLQLVLRDDADLRGRAATDRPAGQATDCGSTTKRARSCLAFQLDVPARGRPGAPTASFSRHGGTVRVMTESERRPAHRADATSLPGRCHCLQRPLYWGPWMCGCQLSLYGHIGLARLGDTIDCAADSIYQEPAKCSLNRPRKSIRSDRSRATGRLTAADNRHSDQTRDSVPDRVKLQWTANICCGCLPTAPVVAGGLGLRRRSHGGGARVGSMGKWHGKRTSAVPSTIRRSWPMTGSMWVPPMAVSMPWRLARGGCCGLSASPPARRGSRCSASLISRWPVAGGVVVDKNTVYAAAGITHYDGTYVVALDALSGQLEGREYAVGSPLARRSMVGSACKAS